MANPFPNSWISAGPANFREFADGLRLDRPDWLWLAAVPALLALTAWLTRRRERKALALVGSPEAVAALTVHSRRHPWIAAALFGFAWLALSVGAAGPRWGEGEPDGVAVGRDVIVVIDLSRSMLADDTATGLARWQLAVAGIEQLFDVLSARGGYRAALVAFAARPVRLVPLTADFDHLRGKLAEVDGARPPPGVRPADERAASGTRIGAAVAAAVAARDDRFPGTADVILLSDGDDPADDREWAGGVSAARAADVPVHAVGLGDLTRDAPIFLDGEQLFGLDPNGAPVPVRSRLNEEVLRAIALEGRGKYLPARRDVPALAEFYRDSIERNTARELTGDATPRPKDRSSWFFAASAVLFAIAWRWGR